MRTLSSAVILVLLLGSCGLKAPIYIPKDPSRCLGCSVDAWFNVVKKKKSKLEGQEEPPGKEKSKLEGQEKPLDKEQFKYIPKVKGQKN
jgi:predicted small lipoprotein YifL